jgi:hypothetical protein
MQTQRQCLCGTLRLCFGALCTVIISSWLSFVVAGKMQEPPASGVMPDVPDKQKPGKSTFNGCPPEGKGGDADLNVLKNRDDAAANYHRVAFDTILHLPWPRVVDKRSRISWPAAAKLHVERFEGTPITVDGYLVLARLEKKEACNCESFEDIMHDVHIWLTADHQTDEQRTEAIVVEVTPRIRAKHSKWTPARLVDLGKAKTHVRVSGWLLLDQEHPEQLDHERGTLWEIHPVMEIEIDAKNNGTWLKLDDA